MPDNNPNLINNGGKGTAVGNFLRSIGKSKLLEKVFGVGAELLTGDVKGAVAALLNNSKELTPEQREHALKLLESDIKENEEITKRWQSDNNSDSWLAKNIRPMVLGFLMLTLFIYIILDSSLENVTVAKEWISLLSTILSIVIVAYFGGRSYEKSKRL
ncbi:MAG: hypothetical protein GY928_02315 [Colwellia sp.]|nr:hypothetical protein [Colwellia sp.]